MSEFNLFLMFSALFAFFVIYRIFTIVYDVSVNDLPASHACGSPAPYIGATGLACILAGLIILAWKLRRVHDAYFIKTEFSFLMAIAIFIVPFFMIANFTTGTPYIVGCWGMLIGSNFLATLR